MMKQIIIKEIEIILSQLFIIEESVRDQIRKSVALLDDEKLVKAEKLLLELYDEQIKVLAKHLVKNPNLIKQLSDLKKETEKIIKTEKTAKVTEDTQKKIIAIMQKINSL